jgi:hypothetical protein
VLIEELLVLAPRFINGIDRRRSSFEVDLFAGMDAEFICEFFHVRH